MKFMTTLAAGCLVCALALFSCQNNSESVRDQAVQSVAPAAGAAAASMAPGGIAHYICPNNCAGSGGAEAGNCQVCGTAYTHNQAFNDQQQPDPAASPPVTINQPQTPEPAKNAAGVYHYTCSNGCAGGAGAAGNCPSCGNPLAHNQAYHE